MIMGTMRPSGLGAGDGVGAALPEELLTEAGFEPCPVAAAAAAPVAGDVDGDVAVDEAEAGDAKRNMRKKFSGACVVEAVAPSSLVF